MPPKAPTRVLKCFVLIKLCCKTKHLINLVQDLIRGFEWLEILRFRMGSQGLTQHVHCAVVSNFLSYSSSYDRQMRRLSA